MTDSAGTQLLSRYPAPKVIVACELCGIRAQYDKLDMLEAGGDRPLSGLLREIARRKGCPKADSFEMHDRCRLAYANIQAAPNAYAKAKGS